MRIGVYTILCSIKGRLELKRIKADSITTARLYVTTILHAQVITIE